MAFGLKYELLCTTRLNRLFKAKVYFDGYEGDDIDRDVPVSPFILRKDKAAVIRGTSFEFSMREEVDFEFLEFYTNSNKKIKVELVDPSDTLIWVGYNLPQQYQVPYVPPPASVSFTATDGLGLLKLEPFALTGVVLQLDIIRYCIDKIGLGLGYSIAINLFEATHNHERTPLAQTYEDAEIFAGLNCYEAIEKVLNKYNAEITQRRGRWAITCNADKKSTRMLYTWEGVYEGTEAAPAVLNMGKIGEAGVTVYPRGSLNMTLAPGAKQVKIKHVYGRKDSLFDNADFASFDGSNFTGWQINGSGTTLEQRFFGEGAYAYLSGYANAYLYQQKAVVAVAGEDFTFSIMMGACGYHHYGGLHLPTLMVVRMLISLTAGEDVMYLTNDGWSETPQYIDTNVTSSIGGVPRMNQLNITTNEIPFSGTIKINLYWNTTPALNYVYNGVCFSMVNLFFTTADGNLYSAGFEKIASFPNSTEPNELPDIEILAGDAPDVDNTASLYKNILKLFGGGITGLWHRLGSTTMEFLYVQLCCMLASDNRVARQKLSGELKGSGIAFDSIIKHAYNGNREFEISEGAWLIYEEIFNVTLLELLAWSNETVVLSDVADSNLSQGGSETTGGGMNPVIVIPGDLSGDEILTKLLLVDGTGSGLDADLLDGKHANEFALIDSPVFTTKIQTPSIYGSDADNGDIIIEGTSSATKTTSYVLMQQSGGGVGIGMVPSHNRSLELASGMYVNGAIHMADGNSLWIAATLDDTGGRIKINHYALTGHAYFDYYDELHFRSGVAGSTDKIIFKSSGEVQFLTGGLHIGGTTDAGDNNLLVDGYVKTDEVNGIGSFVSGFAGSNFSLKKNGSDYDLTVDNLTVRKSMKIYEFDINKINSVNGGIIISSASGTCLNVSGTTIYFDEDGTSKQIQFVVNDYIRAQVWTGRGVNSYVGHVTAVNHSATYGSANIVATTISGAPFDGMELVQIGNSTVTTRQSLIYLTASDTNNPYIDMLANVDAGVFTHKHVLRIGNLTGLDNIEGISGDVSGYGLYAQNVYLSGKIVASEGMIAQWRIWSNGLYKNSGVDATSCGMAPDDYPFYAGKEYVDRATAPFRITTAGAVTATSGSIGGWTLSSVSFTSTVGSNNMELNASTGDITGNKFYMYGHLGHYNYSQQSTPYSPTAANLPNYVCLDNDSESTFNLPSSGLPGGGSTTWIIINHLYGTGLGANKYHINGNGYYILSGGTQVSSIDVAEGHAVMLVWEPRGGGYWTVVGN